MIGSAEQDPLSLGSPHHLDREIPSPGPRLVQVPTLRHLIEITYHPRLSQKDSLIGLQGLDLGCNRFVDRQFNRRYEQRAERSQEYQELFQGGSLLTGRPNQPQGQGHSWHQ